MTGLRGVAQTRGLIMPASGLGKLKMASQVVAVLLLVLAPEVGGELGQLAILLGHARAVDCPRRWRSGRRSSTYQTFTAVLSGRSPVKESGHRTPRLPPRRTHRWRADPEA